MSGLRMSEWWGLVTNWLNKEGLQMTLCPLTVITRVFSVSCLQCLSAPREAETMWDMRLKTCEVTLLYGFSLFVLINTSALFHPSLYIRPSIAIVVRLWQRMNVWSFIFHTYFIKVHAFDVIRVIMSMPKNILILPGYRTVIFFVRLNTVICGLNVSWFNLCPSLQWRFTWNVMNSSAPCTKNQDCLF